MIYIKKNAEPQSLKNHKRTPGADFDGLDKAELRNSLLVEQGFLCAYCMKRIKDKNDTKIEHYVARNAKNQLSYNNLLAVCKGNEGKSPKNFTCDTMKKNQVLHINPLKEVDMNTIYYDMQGKIYSDMYQQELDIILNLNDEYGYLVGNRYAAIKAIQESLKMLKPGQTAKEKLEKLKKYCNKDKDTVELPEYVGIMRWYIERSLRKHNR